MDSWIYEKINSKHIENYSLDKCKKLLGSTSLFLHDYDILCVGYKNNLKHYYQIKILASSPQSKSLQGPHEIIVHSENSTVQFWVWSLTTLRKYFFEFTDRLSFERSAFLILRDQQVLLRLKCARPLLQILRKYPQQIQKKLMYDKEIFIKPYESVFIQPCQKVIMDVSIRIKEQQKNLLEKSYTSYLREFENTNLTKEQIFQNFYKDIFMNVCKLNDTASPVQNLIEDAEVIKDIEV